MAQAPTLSVILPNYNHGHLLPRAVQALLAQERPPDEILLIDDGSSDDSRAVIEQIAAAHATVCPLFNESNRGVVTTSRRGLDAAIGSCVYLAAADDWVMPGFFKLALEALSRHPSAGLFCGESLLVDGTNNNPIAVRPPVRPAHRAKFLNPAEAAQQLKISDHWILTNCCVFRRDCVYQAGGLEKSFGPFADGILARKIALTHGFFFAPQVVACWAVFSEGYSRDTAANIDQAKHYLDLIPARLAQDPAFPKWYPAMFANRWRFATSRLALERKPFDYSLITAMGARSSFDRAVLKVLYALPVRQLVRLTTLAWLWFRLRPTSLLGLARTALASRMRHFPRSASVLAPGSSK